MDLTSDGVLSCAILSLSSPFLVQLSLSSITKQESIFAVFIT